MATKKIALFVALLGITALGAAAGDPFIGTWKLNREKSKFDPGPMPQNITHTYEPFGKSGMKITTVTVSANGKESSRTYTEEFDGKEYPEPNDPGRDVVSIKRVGISRHEGIGKLKGVITAHFSRQISPDGKTMTIQTDGLTPDGKPKHDIRVFDKQ